MFQCRYIQEVLYLSVVIYLNNLFQIHEKLRHYERQSPTPVLHSAAGLVEDVSKRFCLLIFLLFKPAFLTNRSFGLGYMGMYFSSFPDLWNPLASFTHDWSRKWELKSMSLNVQWRQTHNRRVLLMAFIRERLKKAFSPFLTIDYPS